MSNDIHEAEQVQVEDDRTGMVPEVLRRAFVDHVQYSQGKSFATATQHDRFVSLALMARDRLVRRWIETQKTYRQQNAKRAYYLSAEFLLGRALASNLLSLGIYDETSKVVGELGIDLDDLLEQESDAGLGNGGLGRLAACFLDSMATLGLPGYGYGIRYQFGIFEQVIRNGFQIERPETWLKFGNPWEVPRPERRVRVEFYGNAEHYYDDDGSWRARWINTQSVIGLPYDTPVAGYGTDTVNTLRLWEARASEEFDLELFNDGDYEKAVAEKNQSEVISKVLYPNDKTVLGKELRLKQQYFFVRCALVDIIRRHLEEHDSLDNLPSFAAIQLNDTHPSIAIAELMRILVDEQRMEWEKAWDLTNRTISYTNHTVLAEALERWSVQLIGRLLPRHLEIIFEINRRFLRQVLTRWPNDLERLSRMSLVEEGGQKRIRMSHLAIVGSHSVNGVAELHTSILKNDVFRDFFELYPERFNNKTNGVTPRRWLLQSNRGLSSLISETIGDEWTTNLDMLEQLKPLADDASFRQKIRDVKRHNKVRLSNLLGRQIGAKLDPDAIFDMQIKRMHEYKRQLLNILHVVSLYVRARREQVQPQLPRVFLFGGKAAPGYRAAKLIIKLINAVAATIEDDYQVHGLMVQFVPNYRVSLAEVMIPACEVSEQISTAGMEASGTGNMKLSLNGALTVGTLDGANIEIREAVGPDNFFLFGMTAEQIVASRRGSYDPRKIYDENQDLQEALDLIASGFFSPDNRGLFQPIVTELLSHDPYRVIGDFASYAACQKSVAQTYQDKDKWNRMAVTNIAMMGKFSSDRTIRQYASEIWGIKHVDVTVPPYDPNKIV